MEDDGKVGHDEVQKKESNKMGFVSCTSYVIGNIIGSGIFITPVGIVQNVGSVGLSLAVWVGCGLISLLGSIVYIELGTSILAPGCDFAYVCHVKWFSAAFAFMWVGVLLTYPASVAVQALTFGRYMVEGLSPLYKFDASYELTVKNCVGLILLILVIYINFYSLGEVVSKFQIAATVAKLGSVGLIILAGFYWLVFKEVSYDFKHPMANSSWAPVAIVLAFYDGLWSYAGWDILNYGATEVKNPRRNMPLSLLIGISTVTIIYTAINGAFFAVLPIAEIKNTTAIAASFSQVVFGQISYVIPFMVAILICGTLNSNIFCASRYMYAAAKEGHLPPFLSCVNEDTGSPRPSLLAQGLIAGALMVFADVETLIVYVAFSMFLQRMVTMMALVYIRIKRIPVDEGAIRVPLPLTILFLLINVVLICIPIIQNFKRTLIGAVFLASGLLVYFLLVKPAMLPETFDKINDFLNNWTMKLLNCKTDVKGSDVEEKQAENEKEEQVSD